MNETHIRKEEENLKPKDQIYKQISTIIKKPCFIIQFRKKGFISKIKAFFGFGYEYIIIEKTKINTTEKQIQIGSEIQLKLTGKNIWIEGELSQKYLEDLNYNFLYEDNLGRLDSYTATLSRYLPSHTMRLERLEAEIEAQERLEKSKKARMLG